LIRYDSSSKFEETFVKTLENYKKHSQDLKNKNIYVDDPHIGDSSFYYLETNSNVETIRIYFTNGNYYAKISVTDENGKSLDEANRIARIVDSRLGLK